jgi:UDP-N-acetylmuramate: L-alanyl-gamma-D-glutamyl-meso-diaminopimelate ligase
MQQQDGARKAGPKARQNGPRARNSGGATWIIGVGGVAMGALAICLRRMGQTVGGSDQGIYPPMSDMLREAGVTWEEGYARGRVRAWRERHPELRVVVGNAIPRGNPELEEALALGCPLTSLPEVLRHEFLPGARSVVISGTHGKTTTANLAAWLLEQLGLQPGWFIGGRPGGLGESLRPIGAEGAPFVSEGDEYDSVFYDKRSKFFHYWPRVLVINHVEFDHADIFSDLEAIRTAFRRLVNQVPENGLVLLNAESDEAVAAAARGLAPLVGFGASADSAYRLLGEEALPTGSLFRFALPEDPAWVRDLAKSNAATSEPMDNLATRCATLFPGSDAARLSRGQAAALGRASLRQPDRMMEVSVRSPLGGAYNGRNILAALAVVDSCGGDRRRALELLQAFSGPARRMDGYTCKDGLLLYDDFGHHPTAVREALAALRHKHPDRMITALVEPRSNTSVRNVMQEAWMDSLSGADAVVMGGLHRPWKYERTELFDFAATRRNLGERGVAFLQEDDPARIADMLRTLLSGQCPESGWERLAALPPERHLWVIFSNGSFGGLRQRLLEDWKGMPAA